MAERRHFTAADLDAIHEMAWRRLEAARASGSIYERCAARTRIQGYIDGWKGEWAVADSLGLPRPRVIAEPDPGWDLIAEGNTLIQVRYRSRPDGRLMHAVGRPAPADLAVLVTASGHPLKVIIAGAVPMSKLLTGHLDDFGHGPMRWLAVSELDRWEPWKSVLRPAA